MTYPTTTLRILQHYLSFNSGLERKGKGFVLTKRRVRYDYYTSHIERLTVILWAMFDTNLRFRESKKVLTTGTDLQHFGGSYVSQ